MATCPDCGGPLTDDHRCFPNRVRLFIDRFVTFWIGGLAGGLVLAMFDLALVGFVIGAFLALAIRETFRM